jgi:crotonobetainyl-CoA:carnitine CoA-transferase CaiB-like acyl-CoA transferase
MEAPETTGAPADGADDAIVSCSTSGYGRSGRRAGCAGRDIDHFQVGGFLAASRPRGDGEPPIHGATAAAPRQSGAIA